MTVGPHRQRLLKRQCPDARPRQPPSPPRTHPSLKQPAPPPGHQPRPRTPQHFVPKIRNQTKPRASSRTLAADLPRRRWPRKWRTPYLGCRTTSSSRGTMRSRAFTTPPSSSSTAPSPRSTSELPP